MVDKVRSIREPILHRHPVLAIRRVWQEEEEEEEEKEGGDYEKYAIKNHRKEQRIIAFQPPRRARIFFIPKFLAFSRWPVIASLVWLAQVM